MTLSDKYRSYNALFSEAQAVYHEYAVRQGISDSVSSILYAIFFRGGCCPIARLCMDTGLSKQTIHSALQKLEREKLLYLEALDGKAKQAHLTDSGMRYAAAKVQPLMEMEDSILCSWQEEELDQYIRLTERFLKTLKEKVEEFEYV